MQNEGMKVFVRVRPPISREVEYATAVSVHSGSNVQIRSEKVQASCSYDCVFDEVSDQACVFDRIKPLLSDVLAGYNACLFAYGQTSAGKSYTIIGPNGGQDVLHQPRESWGILPRAAEYLFGELADKAEEGLITYHVKASFLQLYNENLYDLLQSGGPRIDTNDANQWGDREATLKIREIPTPHNRSFSDGSSKKSGGITNEVYVAGLSEFRVQTANDVMRILATGTYNRATRSTDFNATSSRSHAVLQLTFDIESYGENGQTCVYKSKLSLVDLAGSEKMQDSMMVSEDRSGGKHVKELTSINKSLSCLGNVISALSSSTRTHIPYRDSKLTRLLQDSFGGNTRTILIACVAPTIIHASETMNTLNFADRAKNVMLRVKANTVTSDKTLLARAEQEIQKLKLLLKHTLQKCEGGIKYGESEMSDEIANLMAENEAIKKENSKCKERIRQLELIVAKGGGASNDGPAAMPSGGFGGYNSDYASGLPPFPKKKKMQSKKSRKLESIQPLGVAAAQQGLEPDRTPGRPRRADIIPSAQSQQQHQPQQPQLPPQPQQPQQDNPDEDEYADEQFSEYDDDFDAEDGGADDQLGSSRSGKAGKSSLAGSFRGNSRGSSRTGSRSKARRGSGSDPTSGGIAAATSEMAAEVTKQDVQELRTRLNRAASESQHQRLDSKLQAVEKSLQRNLKAEEESLSHIQKMKRALEAELAALQVSEPAMEMAGAKVVGGIAGGHNRVVPLNQMPSPHRGAQAQSDVSSGVKIPLSGDPMLTNSIDKSLAMLLKQQQRAGPGSHPSQSNHQQQPISGPRQAYGGPIPKISKANRLGVAHLPVSSAMDRNIAAAFRSSVAAATAAVASPTTSLSPTKASRQHGHVDESNEALTEEQIFQKIQKSFAGINQNFSSHLPNATKATMPSSNLDAHSHVHGSPAHYQHAHHSHISQSTHSNQGNQHHQQLHNHQNHHSPSRSHDAGASWAPQVSISPPKHKEKSSTVTTVGSKSVISSMSSALSAHDDDDSPVRAQNAPVELSHSKLDIGKTIQMFSFRFNVWENIQLVDFDANRSLHKCMNKADGSTQWLDLKKKPIRSIEQADNGGTADDDYEDD